MCDKTIIAIFLNFKTFKIQFYGVSPSNMDFPFPLPLDCKIHINMPKMTFKPVNIDILFLHKSC